MSFHTFSKSLKVGFVCLNLCVLPILFSSAVLAQTSSLTSETDPIIKKLNEEKARLELEAAILKEREANLSLERRIQELESTPIIPKPSDASDPAKLPANTSIQKADFATIESRILAYESMGLIAEDIANKAIGELQKNGIQNVVIDNGEIKAALILHSIYAGQILRLRKIYESEFEKSKTFTPAALDLTPLTIPSTVLRTVIDFVALFRSKDTVFVETFEVDQTALGIKLGSEFNRKNQNLKVFYPGVNLVNL